MLTSEGSNLPYSLGMIMDGHTAFEHPLSYVPLYSDASRILGMAGATYSPTFVVGGRLARAEAAALDAVATDRASHEAAHPSAGYGLQLSHDRRGHG